MGFQSSGWQLAGSLAVFVFGGLFLLAAARRFDIGSRRAIFVYVWHSIFCLTYLEYSIYNVADASFYFERSLNVGETFSFGTGFIDLFTALFSALLGLSYLGVFLVYNVIGCIGLLAFYGAIRQAVANRSAFVRRAGFLIVLLPSISFWSSGIGKDSISFMAVGLALWSALHIRRRVGLMAFAITAMLLIRPHMAALMIAALLCSAVFARKISLPQRISMILIAFLAAAMIIPFALRYAGLDTDSGASDVAGFIERRQGFNQDGGGGIDISSMSPPAQLFSYLFRPLPFEAHSVTSLAASFDNTVLLIICLIGGVELLRKRRRALPGNRIFLWAYVGASWIVLSVTTANLGISMRQKWMFVPCLVYLLISVIGRNSRQSEAGEVSSKFPELDRDDEVELS